MPAVAHVEEQARSDFQIDKFVIRVKKDDIQKKYCL